MDCAGPLSHPKHVLWFVHVLLAWICTGSRHMSGVSACIASSRGATGELCAHVVHRHRDGRLSCSVGHPRTLDERVSVEEASSYGGAREHDDLQARVDGQ